MTLSEHMRSKANLAHFHEGFAAVAGNQEDAEHSARQSSAAEGLLNTVVRQSTIACLIYLVIRTGQ
jgi:hypothetical protein